MLRSWSGLGGVMLVAACSQPMATPPAPPVSRLFAAPSPAASPVPDTAEPPARRQPVASCEVTVCLSGAGPKHVGGNPAFARLCEPLPGLVPACSADGVCSPAFQITEKKAALTAALEALDHNDDGRIDDGDPQCVFNIVGYSWGGVNATELAKTFLHDERVASSHRAVDRLVVIDPYRPMARVEVPQGVSRFHSIRQSDPPTNDCSRNSPLGPYRGLLPRCEAAETCEDLDVSSTPDTRYPMSDRRTVEGRDVGHCRIVGVATPMVWSLFGVDERRAEP
ncbi:MAG: hypothetical protein AAGA54_11880 [Myxococcota bacterium]